MRIARLFVLIGHIASVFAEAQEKLNAVDIVTPSPIAISLVGGRGEIEVIYALKGTIKHSDIRLGYSGAGPIRKEEVTIEPLDPPADTAARITFRIRITVTAKVRLKVGDTFTGVLIFESGGKADTFSYTVTESAGATFTLDPAKYDVCVDCRDKTLFTVRVTNLGPTTITKLKVLSVRLDDESNHHSVTYPKTESDCEDEKAPTSPQTSSQATDTAATTTGEPDNTLREDVVPMEPGKEKLVSIAPGSSRSILLRLPSPPYAGAYAGAVNISANDGEPKAVQLTLRTRGPNGKWWCPLLIFILVVLAGAAAAKIFEHFYGSGGGLTRARALLSLDASRAMLGDLAAWLRTSPVKHHLHRTDKALADDLTDLTEVLSTATRRTPTDLETFAERIGERIAKRRALQSAVAYAKDDPKIAGLLDAVSTESDVKAYRDALNRVLSDNQPEAESARIGTTDRLAQPRVSDPVLGARKALLFLPKIRYVVWMLVVLSTAYAMFYATRCSFGTRVDYITVFLWALGLTQAGFAIIGEARSNYTPPTNG